MRGYPKFSFWIPIGVAKICFSPHSHKPHKSTAVLVGTILKGPQSATPLFLFVCKSLAIIFYSELVKMNKITVKVLKIMKHTFRNTTHSKAISFRFTMQYQ